MKICSVSLDRETTFLTLPPPPSSDDSPTPLPTLERQSAVEDTDPEPEPREPEPEPEQPERRQVGFVSDGAEADDEEPVERHTRLHRRDTPHHLKNKRIVTNKVGRCRREGGEVVGACALRACSQRGWYWVMEAHRLSLGTLDY